MEKKNLLGFKIGNYTTQTGIFLLLFNFDWPSPSDLFTLNWKIFVTYMTIGMSRICFLSENASLRFFGQICTHREDKSRFKWIELHMYIVHRMCMWEEVVTIYGMAREKHYICKKKNQFVLAHKNF